MRREITHTRQKHLHTPSTTPSSQSFHILDLIPGYLCNAVKHRMIPTTADEGRQLVYMHFMAQEGSGGPEWSFRETEICKQADRQPRREPRDDRYQDMSFSYLHFCHEMGYSSITRLALGREHVEQGSIWGEQRALASKYISELRLTCHHCHSPSPSHSLVRDSV
jgi:hypothetical protein